MRSKKNEDDETWRRMMNDKTKSDIDNGTKCEATEKKTWKINERKPKIIAIFLLQHLCCFLDAPKRYIHFSIYAHQSASPFPCFITRVRVLFSFASSSSSSDSVWFSFCRRRNERRTNRPMNETITLKQTLRNKWERNKWLCNERKKLSIPTNNRSSHTNNLTTVNDWK